eukprot:4266326-Ditylum_brightwellii.AAC.1
MTMSNNNNNNNMNIEATDGDSIGGKRKTEHHVNGNPAKKTSSNKGDKEDGTKKMEEGEKRDMMEIIDDRKM